MTYQFFSLPNYFMVQNSDIDTNIDTKCICFTTKRTMKAELYCCMVVLIRKSVSLFDKQFLITFQFSRAVYYYSCMKVMKEL